MPFGISSGPEEYQRRQHEFLDGLKGIIYIADDMCIFRCGDTKEEAIANIDHELIALLYKCRDHDLRLSAKKLQFKASSVTFMGHKLTDKGVEPDPSKVEAIKEMSRPADKAAVQRLLRMCQYFSKFCPNLSETFLPFRNLTSKTQYLYGLTRMKTRSIQQRNSLHQRLLCEITMTRIIHVQIEKECPAIVTCMSKWHQYLYGKGNITVHTDHQPLETIFNKPLSKTPRRLQRMILNLQQYQFKVTYKKRKELHVADTWSRAALSQKKN